MSEHALFDAMYALTEQLKGAPLREDEKEKISDEFEKAPGSPFDRAIAAVTDTLHAQPSLIFEKSEALEVVDKLLQDVRKKAADLES
jgi:hypothetical protein